jgi:multimeric flavodoxin WrbA
MKEDKKKKVFSDKKVKVLGISGATREEIKGHKFSRSEKMLEKMLKHVEKFGGESSIIRLAGKKIEPCEGCYSDSVSGIKCVFPCIHQDDTNIILREIAVCDALVLSTPVYWAGVSSLLRILIEKMTALENNSREILRITGREPLEGKLFALLASQDGEGASLALSQTTWALNHMGMMPVPFGMIFEPALLSRLTVKAGLRLIGVRKFEWIENSIRLAARNLVFLSSRLSGYAFDDYKVFESRA